MSETKTMIRPSVFGFIAGAILVGAPLAYVNSKIARERDALRSQVQTQAVAAQELAKPDLPVQVSFRRGILASGYVLALRSFSSQELVLNVSFRGSGSAQARRLVIPANAVREVGESEGWAFTARDTVEVSNPNFRSRSYTVPD